MDFAACAQLHHVMNSDPQRPHGKSMHIPVAHDNATRRLWHVRQWNNTCRCGGSAECA